MDPAAVRAEHAWETASRRTGSPVAAERMVVVGRLPTRSVSPYLGNGPPAPSARAVATLMNTVVTAMVAAKIKDRTRDRRWNMPCSFHGRDSDSTGRLCFSDAGVNYY